MSHAFPLLSVIAGKRPSRIQILDEDRVDIDDYVGEEYDKKGHRFYTCLARRCTYNSARHRNVMRHLKTTHGPRDKRINCSDCGTWCKNDEAYKTHRRKSCKYKPGSSPKAKNVVFENKNIIVRKKET